MGVRSLEYYIKHSVQQGYVDVSIREFCLNYQEDNHGNKPTLVFDMASLVYNLQVNDTDLMLGGRANKYYEGFKIFLEKLSQISNPVFINDRHMDDRFVSTVSKGLDEKYEKIIEIFDLIYNGAPIKSIMSSVPNYRKILTMRNIFKITRELAEKYGQYFISDSSFCDLGMMKFVKNNPSAVAIFSEDSDYLIYSGAFRYFSIKDLHFGRMKTKEYNRHNFWVKMGLNETQMIIFSTLAGNDVVSFQKVEDFHSNLQNSRNKRNCEKIEALVEFIKKHFPPNMKNEEEIVKKIVESLNVDDKQLVDDELIKKSFQMYNINYIPKRHEPNHSVLKFCQNNELNMVYKLHTRQNFQVDLKIYDYRDTNFPNIFNIMKSLVARKAGIIPKQASKTPQKITTKINDKTKFKTYECEPNHPPVYLQKHALMKLLDRKENLKLDNCRFDLLKWIIGIKEFKNVSMNSVPKAHFLEVLTLTFMKSNQMISTDEADLILLTLECKDIDNVKLSQMIKPKMSLVSRIFNCIFRCLTICDEFGTMDDDCENFQYPLCVYPRAFAISFLFLCMIDEMRLCLEVCGLRDFCDEFSLFDGLIFHKFYDAMESSEFCPSEHLIDFNTYRYYDAE